MDTLCRCLRPRGAPTSLDSAIEISGDVQISIVDEETTDRKVMGFSLYGSKAPNFDFVATDDGNHYVAKFRASRYGQILGCDSNPIPKAVIEKFRIFKRRKTNRNYFVYLETGGTLLMPYFRNPEEDNPEQDI